MSNGITFHDREEAKDYITEKFNEGYDTELNKTGHNTWTVYILGKRASGNVRILANMNVDEANRIHKLADSSVTTAYRLLEKGNVEPTRTSEEIERYARAALERNKIKAKVKVTINPSPRKDADMSVSQVEGEEPVINIHPYHKYTTDEYFVDVLQHEIKHIKEEI